MGDTWERKKKTNKNKTFWLRVFSLWSDRDDRMETSNRLSRPYRLEIFGNDWDDPDDHMETTFYCNFL